MLPGLRRWRGIWAVFKCWDNAEAREFNSLRVSLSLSQMAGIVILHLCNPAREANPADSDLKRKVYLLY